MVFIDYFNASWKPLKEILFKGISVQFYLESISSMPATSKTQKVIHKPAVRFPTPN